MKIFSKLNNLKVKRKNLTSIICIIIGALLASFSVACILLPNNAIDYGTAGIAIILSKLTGFNLSLCVLVVFLPFLIIGAISLGKDFVIRAGIGAAVYMVALSFFEEIPFVLNVEHFIAVIFGGAVLGAGLSLILRFGGCIDGSEILANIIVNKVEQKTGKNMSMSGLLVGFNACVYTACFILINQNSALLSLLVYVVATLVIDHFTDRFDAVKQVTIISKEPESIIEFIKNDMHRTCTIMDSEGAVSGENKTVICYVTYFELEKLREKVDEIQPAPFITVTTIDEII